MTPRSNRELYLAEDGGDVLTASESAEVEEILQQLTIAFDRAPQNR